MPAKASGVAFGGRVEIVGVAEAGHSHRSGRGSCVGRGGEDDGGGAVGDRRAVGAPQRRRDDWVGFGDGLAELFTEISADLGVRVVDAVAVVLGGNQSEGVAAVAVSVVVGLRDAGEEAGESGDRFVSGAFVVGTEQGSAYGGGAGMGHLLRADYEHVAGGAGQQCRQPLVQGGRAGCARVLHAGGWHAEQLVGGLQGEGGDECQRGESGVELPDEDGVDLCRLETSGLDRVAADGGDQCLQVQVGELTETRVRPSCE